MIGIETKTFPATNTRPRLICAFTCNGHRLVASYDKSLDSVQAHFKVAQALIREQFDYAPDASTMTYGNTKTGYFFCWPQSMVTVKGVAA